MKRSRWDDDDDSSSSSESEAESHTPLKTTPAPPPTPPSSPPPPPITKTRDLSSFRRLNFIEEGTYGVVFAALDLRENNKKVALKQVKFQTDHLKNNGFPISALRELNILLKLKHQNIVYVRDMVVENNNNNDLLPYKVYMCMDYYENELKDLMLTKMKRPFQQNQVKQLMLQLLSGINYIHQNWVIHRDLKTSNLLYNNYGNLSICDFGMARKYDDPIGNYTKLVVTLHYRPLEILLGIDKYSTKVDMWSLGCIFAELIMNKTLFPGEGEVNQIDLICKTLGVPQVEKWEAFEKLKSNNSGIRWRKSSVNKLRYLIPQSSMFNGPYLSDVGLDLLSKMLEFNPENRISAEEALRHPWFDKEFPPPISKDLLPTFPDGK